jgi:hypothetical protein
MIIGVLICLSALAVAQSVTEANFIMNPTDCLGTVVTLSSCTSMLENVQLCSNADDPIEQAGCYCQQSVLDYMAG